MNIKRSLWIGLLLLSVASANGASFFDKRDSTVIDLLTNLTWVQTETSLMTWEAALVHCEGLNLAGKTDWRLPNINELESIADYRKSTVPSIDLTYFPYAVGQDYWTSTSSSSASALSVHFYGGYPRSDIKTSSLYVRCVR